MAAKWLTEAEARTRFGDARVTRYADRNGDGAADTGVVDGAIERAEAMVEAKLLTRYAPGDLPSTTATASLLLKEIVGGFFIWCLTDTFEIRGDDITQALRTAEKRLDDVTRGTSSLLIAGNPAVDLSAAQVASVGGVADSSCCGIVSVCDETRGTFTRASMRDW